MQVQEYVKSLRESGGVVNSAIIMAAERIVKRTCCKKTGGTLYVLNHGPKVS